MNNNIGKKAEILHRITVILRAIAEAFRGTVTVEELSSALPHINNLQLSSQMTGFGYGFKNNIFDYRGEMSLAFFLRTRMNCHMCIC